GTEPLPSSSCRPKIVGCYSRSRRTGVRFGVRCGPIGSQLITARAVRVGAGGGTRTHTAFYGPRILSPVRLPFRHTGKNSSCRSETKSRIRFRKELTVPSEGGFHGL